MKKSLNKDLAIIFILFTFFPILFSHFQQDEWHNFAWHIYNMNAHGFWDGLQKSIFSFLPVTQGFNFLNYQLFGIQNIFPAVTILVLIWANSSLWGKNIYSISKSKLISIGSTLFGYLSVISHQAVSWVMPAIATQFAFLFINLSIYYVIKARTLNNQKYLLYVLLFSFLAIFSKVNAFFIFLFLPVLYLIIHSSKINYSLIKKIIGAGVVTLSIVIGYVLLQPPTHKIGAGRYVSSKKQLVANTVLLPTKSISQLIIDQPKLIYSWSSDFLTIYYGRPNDQLLFQTLLTDYLSVVLSLIFILIFVLFFRITKKNKSTFLFGVSFYYLSFIPYFFDKFSTGTGFLESRYYYLSAFGLGIVLFLFVDYIFKSYLSMTVWQSWIRKSIYFIIWGYLVWSGVTISNQIIDYNEATSKRIEILDFIKNRVYINEADDVILFIQDSNYPNSQVTNITGTNFQTGLLYPFLVYSFDTGQVPYQVFEDDFYWNMEFQGGRQVSGEYIGLFYDFERLQTYIRENNLSSEAIYAFDFDYSKLQNNSQARGNFYDLPYVTYTDITQEIRQQIGQ